MQKWNLAFNEEADRDLSGLDKFVRKRVIEKLEWLEKNFSEISPVVLTADYRNFFKLRVGDWRVFYKIDWNKNIIIVCYIDHRNKAYKNKKK